MVKTFLLLVLGSLAIQFLWYSIWAARLIRYFRNQTPPAEPINSAIARVAPLPTLKNYRDSLISFALILLSLVAFDSLMGGELAGLPWVIFFTFLMGFVAVSAGLSKRVEEYKLRRRQLAEDSTIFQPSNLTPATIKKSGTVTAYLMPGFHCVHVEDGKQTWLPYDMQNSETELKGFVFKFPKPGMWWNFRPRLGFISEDDLRDFPVKQKSAS